MVNPYALLRLMILIVFAVSNHSISASENKGFIKLSVESEIAYLGDRETLFIETAGLQDPLNINLPDGLNQTHSETVGTRIMVVGGKVMEVKLRRIEFAPERTGVFVIGPFSAGSFSSNSVSVEVQEALNSDWKPQDDDLKISVSVNSDAPYIHAQTVLELVLTHRYPVTEETIELPDFNGFTVRTVFEKRRTFTDDDERQRQIAWRFLLFANTAGESEIGAVRWQGTIVKSRLERAAFDKRSKPIRFTVVPPANSDNQWWLPAQQVSLEESWSDKVTELRAGDEVTRTLTVKSIGVLAGQIPTPNVLQSRALNQTLLSAKRTETVTPSGMQAKAEFVYRVKAQSPIPVFLDTVRMPWWNTQTNKAAEVIIPARRINVGLPDRADLLKKIAQEQTGISAYQSWWYNAGKERLVLYALTFIVLVPLVIISAKQIGALARNNLKALVQRRLLTRLAQQRRFTELVEKLSPFYATQYGNNDNPLLARLQRHLYAKDVTPLDVTHMVAQIGALNLRAQSESTPEPKLSEL